MTLADMTFEEARKLHLTTFSLDYLQCSPAEKLGLIAMVCYVTNELNKKRSNYDKLTCYDVLKLIDKDASKHFRENFLKGLGVVCQDFMTSDTGYPDFGMPAKEMPKKIKQILDTFLPF